MKETRCACVSAQLCTRGTLSACQTSLTLPDYSALLFCSFPLVSEGERRAYVSGVTREAKNDMSGAPWLQCIVGVVGLQLRACHGRCCAERPGVPACVLRQQTAREAI